MSHWFDAHNHLQDPRLGDAGRCFEAAVKAGVSGMVVNATGEDEWAAVGQLAATHEGRVRPAIGVHPWRAHEVKDGWLDRMRDHLRANPRTIVGEVGLDGWVKHPPMDVQRPVFIAQLKLARELGRPLVIHCLKAWNPLLEGFRSEPPPPSFLLHSYGGSIELARQLIPMGAYFSFSGYFLSEKKRKVLEVFRQLPRERILIETDAPDMLPPAPVVSHPLADGLNHPANLPAIGEAFAKALGMPAPDLAEMTAANARRCFAF